ncbi:MAG: cytochrome C oxidase subunit IV family protein [Chloroflexota bacterium]|nr:cytochrome C oxidase subunit IV family protein [Chloroflexota bacterium]
MKEFFENPALLFGVPLLAVGLFGALVAMLAPALPETSQATAGGLMLPSPAAERHGAHPGPEEYVKIGATLAIITAFEVILYYINIPRGLFVLMLLGLSALKFSLVVLWFMHLRFDSRLFSTAFVTGLVLAFAVFTVVIATLGSNLV